MNFRGWTLAGVRTWPELESDPLPPSVPPPLLALGGRGVQRRAIEAEYGRQSNQGERHDARPGQEAYVRNDADTGQGLICYPAIPPMR